MTQNSNRIISISPILIILSFLVLSMQSINAQSEQEIIDTAQAVGNQQLLPTAPVDALFAKDKANDGGGAVELNWHLSADDADLKSYLISRAESKEGPFELISEAVKGKNRFIDNKTTDGVAYFYQVVSVKSYIDSEDNEATINSIAVTSGSSKSTAQWFNTGRAYCLFFVLLISGAIIFYINRAKSGAEIYIRKIAGIDAVEEAVGRATEMGSKIFFIPGIQDMNDVQTIAGIAILGRVGEIAAQYETWLEVPVSKSLVMVTARETLKEAYTKVGRPDAFNQDQVHYLTDDQFGYAAAIDGMVVREKPATIFYMGAFFAESLILAETGNAAGAIQIAGTAMPSQLPFFVASCDYTLLGEELFAASAYLSKEPRQLGSLKGQDFGKIIFMIAILLGVLIETFTDINVSQYFSVK